MTVRTRFAPSPTGYLHIGGVRTALFSWLHARHCGGEFILRIEDTDRERSTEAAVAAILDGLRWLELDWDEGPYFQSERLPRYNEATEKLLADSHAYYCFCSREELEVMRNEAVARGEKPRYNGKCRERSGPAPAGAEPVVRFRSPQSGEIVVEDMIQGTVSYPATELDDLIIRRSDGSPTFNFSVVVDDLDMGITHVIRGDDHLNNTARQIPIFSALKAPLPRFAHMPLILTPDGRKLSKRHGTVSVLQYRDEGYLPEALLNYLVRLGWSHGDQEIFSRQEMIDLFDISAVNKSAAAINPEKLVWLNQHYLKTGDDTRLAVMLTQGLRAAGVDLGRGPAVEDVCAVQKQRVKTMTELVEQSRIFYEDFEQFDEPAAKKHLRPVALAPLQRIRVQLPALEPWTAKAIHELITGVAAELDLKLGKIAQPLRVAVTGTAVSPSIDATIWLLGKELTLARLDAALAFIKARTVS